MGIISLGKILIILGVALIVRGLIYNFVPLGRLPGDINIKGENTQIFIPMTTSILLSVLLSIVLYLTRR